MSNDYIEKLEQLIKDQHNKEMNLLRQKLIDEQDRKSQQAMMDALRSHQKSRMSKSEKDATDWDDVNRLIASLLEKDTSHVVNSSWPNGILTLMAALVAFNKALANDVKQNVWIPLGFKLKDKLRNDIEAPNNPMPVLLHDINLNDKDELVVSLTVGENPNNIGINDVFKKLVTTWLKEQGYEPQGTKFVKDGVVLTKDDFKTLKNHPVNGIDAYLDYHGELQYEQNNSMRP